MNHKMSMNEEQHTHTHSAPLLAAVAGKQAGASPKPDCPLVRLSTPTAVTDRPFLTFRTQKCRRLGAQTCRGRARNLRVSLKCRLTTRLGR